jgi:hypothetical protein
MGATTTFRIVQGQAYAQVFALTRDDTGAAVSLASLTTGTPTVEVRNVPNDVPGSVIKTTGSCAITDAANGKISVTFTKAQTALIVDPTWVIDVRLQPATTNWRALFGGISLKLRATT